MRYILIIAGLFLSGTLQAQFTGTDSLRNYNNRYITNNPATAFTNLRLHTLLRGMIDYIDTARAGTGGGGAVGVDTLWALNDSTIRYRENGVFRNFVLKGVYDTRRKVDTAYALNDSTLQIKINGTNRNIILPGRYWDLQGVLNNGATLTENETVTLSDSLTFTSGMVIIDTLNLPSLATETDTTANKPVVVDASGNVRKMTSWPVSPTDSTLFATVYSVDTAKVNLRGEIAASRVVDTIQVHTSGTTVTVSTGVNILYIDPVSTLATLTITLPATPNRRGLLDIYFGGTLTSGEVVTAITISPNSGQSKLEASTPGYVEAGEHISYQYRVANTKWYRKN